MSPSVSGCTKKGLQQVCEFLGVLLSEALQLNPVNFAQLKHIDLAVFGTCTFLRFSPPSFRFSQEAWVSCESSFYNQSVDSIEAGYSVDMDYYGSHQMSTRNSRGT